MQTELKFYQCNKCKAKQGVQVFLQLKLDCVEIRIDKCDICEHQSGYDILNSLLKL